MVRGRPGPRSQFPNSSSGLQAAGKPKGRHPGLPSPNQILDVRVGRAVARSAYHGFGSRADYKSDPPRGLTRAYPGYPMARLRRVRARTTLMPFVLIRNSPARPALKRQPAPRASPERRPAVRARRLRHSPDAPATASSIHASPHWPQTSAGTSRTITKPNFRSTVNVVVPASFLPPQRAHFTAKSLIVSFSFSGPLRSVRDRANGSKAMAGCEPFAGRRPALASLRERRSCAPNSSGGLRTRPPEEAQIKWVAEVFVPLEIR